MRKKIIIALIIAVLGAGSYFLFRKKTSALQFVTIKRGDVVEEVSVTGRVKASENVALAFEKSGKVSWVNVKVGDHVGAGWALVLLSGGDLEAQLAQAEASVKAEKAKLAKLKRGARPEELEIEVVKVKNAGIAVESAKNNAVEILRDVYTKADDTVRRRIDQFFLNPRTPSATLTFTPGLQLKSDIEVGRTAIEPLLVRWESELDSLSLASNFLGETLRAKQNLTVIKSFLDAVALAVNGLTANSNFTQATIDAWKGDISTARTNVNAAFSSLAAAEEKLRVAESNLSFANEEYNLTKAGSTEEDINAQMAVLEGAQAQVKNIQADLSKNVIFAPFSGVVTKQEAKIGEIVASNAPLISLQSDGAYEIESNVPEVDISKIKVGDPVSITLDAFSGEYFPGKVVAVDPAETIVDGVVNFKVTILFDTVTPRLKSGLTANLNIETLRKSGVLVLPQFAIIENDSGTFIRKMENGKPTDIPVTLGIRGRDGDVEVISGLAEGDQVVNIGLKNAE